MGDRERARRIAEGTMRMRTGVQMRTASARELKRERADAAAEALGLAMTKRRHTGEVQWRVDWTKVEREDRWLQTIHGPNARRARDTKVVAERRLGALTLRAVVEVPPRRTRAVLPAAGPADAYHIHGVILRRCAGYARAPRAEDVARGIGRGTPTDAEAKAIKCYVREATHADIEAAWKNEEFTLAKLMHCIEQIGNRSSVGGLRSVEHWLVIEPAPCSKRQ